MVAVNWDVSDVQLENMKIPTFLAQKQVIGLSGKRKSELVALAKS